MNKSSSLLLHLHLHLLHFLIMNKSSYFKKRKKKRRRKFSKRVLGLGALGSYFLGFFQKKKIKIFNSLKEFKISKFFNKKKSSIKNFNSMKKFKISKIFKKKRRRKFSKRALGLGALGSYFLGCLKKNYINQNFNSFQKFKISKFFKKKKKSIKIFNSLKKFKISKIFKKNLLIKIFNSFKKFRISKIFQKNKKIQKSKKKSSLNSSSGTESYDPFPHSPVMQHQVNCPPSAFIEAWSMSQTRGIRQVCQSLFNE